MRVAVISKSNADGGGASRVAEELADLLAATDGIEVHHYMTYPGQRWAAHMRSLSGSRRAQFARRVMQRGSALIGLPDFLTPEGWMFERRHGAAYDIYHFHDISSAFSPVAFRHLAQRRPVVWTLHDCSPFTAGCLYPRECRAFESQCGNCPQLGCWPLTTRLDRTGFMHAYKRQTARITGFVPIAPSQWMADQALRSGFWDTAPQVIPYGVDHEVFRALDKRLAREALGLSADDFIVLLSAGHLSDERKGTRFAIDALRSCGVPVHVLALGSNDEAVLSALRPLTVTAPGYVREKRLLALYYAAADIYLFPSIADNLPNSILECMASGTPTIAFRAGGIPELIEHEVTGWLADSEDVRGLLRGITTAHRCPQLRRAWGHAGRQKACTSFSVQSFLSRHLELYRATIGSMSPGRSRAA